jgi:hypothetical protein
VDSKRRYSYRSVQVLVVITEVGGKGAKVADSEGGGVERSRAGDSKDKLAKGGLVVGGRSR